MSEPETVYVAGRSGGGGGARKLHTDPDCPTLKAARSPLERRRDTYPDDADWCQWCTGDVPRPETQDRSHHNALKAAAEGNQS